VIPDQTIRTLDSRQLCEAVWKENPRARVLNLGCGEQSWGGNGNYVGADLFPGKYVDVMVDLDGGRLPFRTGTFDIVMLDQVVEHLLNVVPLLQECHRVLKEGGWIYLTTPHFSNLSSWVDPTHHKHYSLHSFGFLFWEEKRVFTFPSIDGGFRKVCEEITFAPKQWFARFLYGLSSRRYEKYYCKVIPGRGIKVIGQKTSKSS
jgi:SAM-dependent methyltransferase